ncbi:MAG: ABC transporter ATP-binding protein [Lachnospiraceae bacterium]|nr:ABC transporter ATP-binding protein [Lachnospiraceae bacterium]
MSEQQKKQREPELYASDLQLGYEGRALVSHLNFTVRHGDYLCIVGENGAGKSTLMRTILGLQKPMGGEVHYGDGLSSEMIGYLPQQSDLQRDFPASVREIVLSGFQGQLGKRFFYTREMKQAVQENLARMGISDLADQSFSALSGGQKQRVMLARAVSASRRMLLLDEPVAGLDPLAQEEMYRLIRELNKDGTTIVMISHDIVSALQYATHILHVGKELFFGTVQDYHRTRIGKPHLLGEEKTKSAIRLSHPM